MRHFIFRDDHALMKWNFLLNEVVKVSQLPDDFFPISLHWFPKSGGSARKSGSDLLLAASADGKFFSYKFFYLFKWLF